MIGLLLAGCSKSQDDTGKDCLQSCTVIQGHIVTLNNQPLEGIPIEFNNDKSLPYAPDIRKIAKTQTDENGYYNMSFFIEDEELGEDARGTFEINMDFNSLNTTNYLLLKSIKIREGFFVGYLNPLSERDTTIVIDFYIPKKALATINLNGFSPIQNEDYFKAQIYFPGGYKTKNIDENQIFEFGPSLGEKLKAVEINNKYDNMEVAAGEYNLLHIEKRKDGVISSEDVPFYVPEKGGVSITVDY